MPDLKEKKYLIAYFSRADNNYVGGQIVNLKVGNTKIAAEIIQEIIGGDLFHIDTVTPYPKDYSATTNVAKKVWILTIQYFWDTLTGGAQCQWQFLPFLKNTISLEKPLFHFALTKEAAWATVKVILQKTVPMQKS